ncbi:MAG: CIA30 family protein [Bacteroidales bacterium]
MAANTVELNPMRKIILAIMMMNAGWASAQEIYDFSADSDMGDWYIVDDVVMGGRSDGQMKLSDEGNAIFEGRVSLENNGGFSSVRYRPDKISSERYAAFMVRLKGDTRNYQFRVRSRLNEYQSYVYEFETNGDWQIIRIPFNEMYPSFRGMRLKLPNYPGKQLQECSFLISNKKNENFRLEIDKIWME